MARRPRPNPPRVSAESKEAVRLVVEEGLSVAEAAKRTGMSKPQIYNRLRKLGYGREERRGRAAATLPGPTTPQARQAARTLEGYWSQLAEAMGWNYRTPDPVKNPIAGIPGGSISECIRRMQMRPDVQSPGALCAHLAQHAGETSVRRASRAVERGRGKTAKKRKADQTIRRFLNKL